MSETNINAKPPSTLALGSGSQAAEAYLAKCPEPMSRSDAASAVALVLVEAREEILRLREVLRQAATHPLCSGMYWYPKARSILGISNTELTEPAPRRSVK